MDGRLAIVAGAGALPHALAAANPDAVYVHLAGDAPEGPVDVLPQRLERLGEMFETLRSRDVARIVLAGAITPPKFDPTQLDDLTRAEAPALFAALAQGDDRLLRAVIALIERQGFTVIGAHEGAEDLTLAPGAVGDHTPDAKAQADIARAKAILAALGPLDVGQAAVVEEGRCLGIETVQGTDALLDFVAQTDPARRPTVPGVLVKLPKPGQDLRVDMPALGPDTVHNAARAGLQGIAVMAGQTLVLERAKVTAALAETGLFLWAETP